MICATFRGHAAGVDPYPQAGSGGEVRREDTTQVCRKAGHYVWLCEPSRDRFLSCNVRSLKLKSCTFKPRSDSLWAAFP